MKRKLLALALLAGLVATVAIGIGSDSGSAAKRAKPPKGFFGIAPQTFLSPEEVRYMKAGGLESVRWPLSWVSVQPFEGAAYDWRGFDEAVGSAARGGLEVLPSLGSPPPWVAPRETMLPLNGAQKAAWKDFLRAAVERYGPGGDFWAENPGPKKPIRTWQVWNEANFHYFAFPVNPTRYAKLVTLSSQTIKSVHPGAKIMLAGLFGKPTARGKRGMPAATFLNRLYRYPGIEKRFDGVSLHPYAVDSRQLEGLVEEFHEVLVRNRDRPAMYITEIGWGSEDNFHNVAFGQGPRGQLRQLRDSYEYLLENQRRLKLKGVYWFSWKDIEGSCDFCDSVGLFREGERFKPKPAWRAFVRLTGGRARP